MNGRAKVILNPEDNTFFVLQNSNNTLMGNVLI